MTLSDSLRDAADAADLPTLDVGDLHRRAAGRRRRRGRASAVAGVLVVAAVAGLVGVAAAGDGRQREAAYGTVVSGGSGDGQASSDDGQASSSTTDPTATTAPDSTVPGTAEPGGSTVPEATPETTAPPASTAPTPPTDPTPVQAELEGTYVGDGGYVFDDPRCQEMAGAFTFAVDFGQHGAWELRQENCGEVVGDQWHGDGTWVLDGPSGDLTGTYEVWASMGTSGIPYDMAVVGGTGTFAGATGMCGVTIVISPPGAIQQHQEGTISCLLDIPSSADASASSGAGGSVPEAG